MNPDGSLYVTGINGQTHSEISFTANFALPNLQIATGTFKVSESTCSACSPLTVTAATGFSGTGFTLGDTTPFTVLTFAESDFTISPTSCPVTYGYSITPLVDDPSVIDTTTAFAFDQATQTFTVTSSAGFTQAHAAYTDPITSTVSMSPVSYNFEVWVIDETNTAVNSVTAEKLAFSATLTDPCYLATLDLTNAVVADGTYGITAANTQ